MSRGLNGLNGWRVQQFNARHPFNPRLRIALTLLLLLASCGRVGDPLPPFIRIPEPVTDLTVVQSGYDLILTWTNPARYIDGSAATDLSLVRILIDGMYLAEIDELVSGPQSISVPARQLIGSNPTFSVQFETAAQRLSAASNTVSIAPVEIPGAVAGLRYIVDQNRIMLEWDPPRENSDLANVYIVTEEANEAAIRVTTTMFIDDDYESGKTYTYAVTAARHAGPMEIPGVSGGGVTVTAIDTTPPQVPIGLEIIASDQGAFLIWTANAEDDLAGYRVFRSDREDTGFMPFSQELRMTNEIFDPAYRADLYYAVSAIDESGNESARSGPHGTP